MLRTVRNILFILVAMATPAAAEFELSFYLGAQGVSESTASGTLPNGGGGFSRNIGWEGRPFDAPIYYGGRVMYWTDTNWGFGVEGTHTKAYMPDGDAAAVDLTRFELSDGHNIFTANVMKRWPGALNQGRFTPYVGGGLGVAIPHVDALAVGAANRTYDYENTGVAVRGIAGIKYDFNDRWALFGEYQMTYSENDITIDGDPGQPDGKLNTDLLTHAVNVGISYSF